jgi:hypothetical protein
VVECDTATRWDEVPKNAEIASAIGVDRVGFPGSLEPDHPARL